MKTRVGKIAQLPKEIRDELNQRLQNGKQGPELLRWLNALPETKELLAEKFDDVPISKQNLSEWRQGGYQEWLRHQEHDLRIQRLVEEGECLGKHDADSADDLFEHSARIALAELMADFDTLHELKGEARSQRLLNLTRELSRLQYAYNHSRWTALAYTRWNDRFLGPEDYENEEDETNTTLTLAPTPISDLPSPNQPPSAECHSAVSLTGSRQSVTIAAAPQLETPNPKPETPVKTPEVKPSNTTSTEGDSLGAPASRPAQPLPSPRSDSVALPDPEKPDDRSYLHRAIYHHKNCGHICHNCHSQNSEYPYAEALKDSTEAKQRGTQAFWRERTMIVTHPTGCNCPSHQC